MSADRKRNILQLCKKEKKKRKTERACREDDDDDEEGERLATTTITTTEILPLVNILPHSTPTPRAATTSLNEKRIISGQLPPLPSIIHGRARNTGGEISGARLRHIPEQRRPIHVQRREREKRERGIKKKLRP